MIPMPPKGVVLRDYIEGLLEDDNSPATDTWGPAGCIEVQPGKHYAFFGWASC